MKRFFSHTWLEIPVWWLSAITLAYASIVIAYHDLTPFYDGGIYYASIYRLVTDPFVWANLHMEGHPSPVYALLLAWSQVLWQGAVVPMFATNALLALIATVSMFKLLQLVFGRAISTLECCLGASIYGFMPVLLVHMFHLNLDFGLSVFLVPYVYFLLKKQLWWAALFATAMMLTKETGVLIYALVAGLYAVFYIARPARSVLGALNAIMHRWVLAVPGIIFILYFASYRLFASESLAHWGSGSLEHNLRKMLLDFDLLDASILSFLSNIFILNFNWLLSVTIIACLIRRLWRWAFGLDTKNVDGVKGIDLAFFILVCMGLVYITTRVRPWNNPRYMLAVFPLLVPLSVYCLREVVTFRRMREIFLGCVLLLLVGSSARTIDPVSKAVYGTITFGSHDWLNMTSMIGPGWLRRDPQAYNFEFFQLYYTAREVIQDIRPPENGVILAGPAADFYFANWLDRTTLKPTLSLKNAQRLYLVDNAQTQQPAMLASMLPSTQPYVWFLTLPNLDNAQYISTLARNYRLIGGRTYGQNGYEMTLLIFERP